MNRGITVSLLLVVISVLIISTLAVSGYNVFSTTTTSSTELPLPSALVPPSGIVLLLKLKITNNQLIPTPAPFQQEIIFNSKAYSSYEASNLQNVEFFTSNYSVIPSWLESGASNTSTQTIYWLKLSKGIPAFSSIRIYVGFAKTDVNLFNGNNVGEAPQLSSTFAKYDDGKNVFNFYANFAGDKLDPRFNTFGGWNGSQKNGLIVSSDSFRGGVYAHYSTKGNAVIDADATLLSGSTSTQIGFANSTSVNWYNDFDAHYGAEINVQFAYQPPTQQHDIVFINSTGGTGYYLNDYNISLATPYVFNLLWTKPYLASFIDYRSAPIIVKNSTIQSSSIIFTSSWYSSFFQGVWFDQWLRVRAAPPNGLMPTVLIEN
jgi:hypothetical protein